MRFRSLRIENLRAIRKFEMHDIGDFVVIAGPNGSGKSCVFDAIRLLKSVYGGYQANEYHQWFGEFAINLQDPQSVMSMFRDPSLPIEIEAEIEFAESERTFLGTHAEQLIWPIAWQGVTGQPSDYWTFSRLGIATQLAHFRPMVEPLVKKMSTELTDALSSEAVHSVSVTIGTDGTLRPTQCRPAEVSFQAFAPRDLGIIEYHSAARAYPRQPQQGLNINLDARASQDQRRTQSLYNWQSKYQNVKAELATAHIRRMLTEASGASNSEETDLNDTLKELFRTFFPDKVYEGVEALSEGSLRFPVRLPGGEVHDIDDLSSGEKEILYGYLRLTNATPRNSVLLLDEPELHLNPGLLQGFADFYHRHIGLAQGNQIWMVTHSDTLLRQAVGNANFGVFHMLSATTAPEGNQAAPVLLDDDVERVMVDLVGDLAAYRPHAKVLILEGASEDGFDAGVISRLFPSFARRVNLVSAGPKKRVRDLYEVLQRAGTTVAGQNRFFAVVDRDFDGDEAPSDAAECFTWDVYHVENYLLQAEAVYQACTSLMSPCPFAGPSDVWVALRTSAADLVEGIVLRRLSSEVNASLVRTIAIAGDPKANAAHDAINPAILGSVERFHEAASRLTPDWLAERATEYRSELETALETDAWAKVIPGREVMRRFVGAHVPHVAYEPFRNLVLDKLANQEDRPAGMEGVLRKVEPNF